MQLLAAARRAAPSAVACLRRVAAAPARPAACAALAIVEEMPRARRRRAAAARRARGRRLGLLEPAARRPRSSAGEIVIRRLRQTVSPAGRAERGAERGPHLHRRRRRSSRPRRGGRPARRCDRLEIPPTDDPRRLDRRRPGEGGLMELRVLGLYPEQMNIYADRGNIIFLRRRCEWRGIGFSYAGAGPGERFDPGRPRPLLHRRRPGPRPARWSPPTWSRPSARRSAAAVDDGAVAARRLRRLPAARPQLPARRGDAARASASPTSRRCASRGRG